MKKPKKIDHKLIGKGFAEMQRHGSGVQLNALDWKVYHADGSIYLVPYKGNKPWQPTPGLADNRNLPF